MNKTILLNQAASMERQAKESLPAWIALGQTDKFVALLQKADAYRTAATLRTPNERKQYLATYA